MENLQAQKCRARLDHLESADAENFSEWNNVRVKRILVDYMLRMSYFDTAVKLAESSNIQVRCLAHYLNLHYHFFFFHLYYYLIGFLSILSYYLHRIVKRKIQNGGVLCLIL